MTGPFQIDLDRLDDIVTRLAQLSGFINDKFAELDHRVAFLHDSSWSGRAAEAHATAHREWASTATEFNRGVIDIQSAAAAAHRYYTAALTANKRMLGGS